MILHRLSLRNFRTYERVDLTFEPKINLILGDNAAGKTNLAEAIQFISLARSWRTNEGATLIRTGKEAAYIQAQLSEGELRRTVEIELCKEGKRITINGKPAKRLSELFQIANVIVFAPDDVSLFQKSPADRRTFLDVSLSKHSSDYFSLVSRYNKLLKERNALLKQINPDRSLLDILTEQMIQTSEIIVRYRTMYITSLNAVLPKILEKLYGEKSTGSLVYRPFARDDGRFLERARKAYRDALESDLIHKSTSVGVHREDFSFLLNGKNVADYGSQGENRMAALALKLSPFYLIESEEKKPICVLDDVTSELDAVHVSRLLSLLRDLGQTFVTATHLTIDGATIIDVADHNATRRN